MTCPILQLIAWTTMQVYNTVMRIVPRPLIVDPGAQERYTRAECDFHRIANIANTTSYRIVQTLTTSYVHAPLCPLPAELPYLVPRFAWECLAMLYRQVRMMRAERQIVEELPVDIMDVGPIYRQLRLEAEMEDEDENLLDDDVMMPEMEFNFLARDRYLRARQLGVLVRQLHMMGPPFENIVVHDQDQNIVQEQENVMAGEVDDMLIGIHAISPGC